MIARVVKDGRDADVGRDTGGDQVRDPQRSQPLAGCLSDHIGHSYAPEQPRPGTSGMPNTLIFVDFPSADIEATAEFYRQVMGWEVEGRPAGIFHRIVPGGEFPLEDGTPSGVGHLHLGIYSTAEPRPDPNPPSSPRASGAAASAAPRVYVLVDDRAEQNRILATAERLGATVLWRDRYWREFDGWHGSFRDPWGTQIILWTKPADDSDVAVDAPY